MNDGTLGERKIGLVAGWGRYPLVVAEALARQGYQTYCLGLRGHADPALAGVCHDFRWGGVAQLGGTIRYFRTRQVPRIMLAGKVHKFELFQPGAWLKYMPDWRGARRFYKHFVLSRKDRRDDTLLGAVVKEFARDGIECAPATDFVPELLVKFGALTRRAPTKSQARDIEYGWKLAKEIGRLDVGQSVAIKGRAALAVEAIEGTDECIRRAGSLCGGGGFTVVKVAKPQQDMRFDVPTIGLGTLTTMAEAGGSCLAVEAGKTIIIDEPAVIRYAEQHKITLVAIRTETEAAGLAPPDPETLCESRER